MPVSVTYSGDGVSDQANVFMVSGYRRKTSYRKEIATPVDTLRWDDYQYVREHPICNWSISTAILSGGKDDMQSAEVVQKFVFWHFFWEITMMDGKRISFAWL